MKKLLLNVVLLFGVSVFVQAENGISLNNNRKEKGQSSNELVVEPLGQKDGYVFLKLSASKEDDKTARLSINDSEGNQLFSESFSLGSHTRIIKVLPEEISSLEIDFRSTSGNLIKRYVIHTSRIQTFHVEELSAR